MDEIEEWRKADGCIGYDVSSFGRVRSYWVIGSGVLSDSVQRVLKLNPGRSLGSAVIHQYS